MSKIPIYDTSGGTQGVPAATCNSRAISDLIYVLNSDCYINEKGYLQKLIDLLYHMGYYENNKSLFEDLK
jgi:hypothetical protein